MERWTAAGMALLAGLAAASAIGAAAAPLTIQADGLSISLDMTPSPPARRERTTFEISAEDKARSPVTGCGVSLDLRMPGMAMAENRPPVQERGAGRYVAVGTFSMGGRWIAIVEVILCEGRRVRAEFPLRVR